MGDRVRTTGSLRSVESKMCGCGNIVVNRKRGSRWAETLLGNALGKHELDLSWWNTFSDMKRLQIDNCDSTERESLCSQDGEH